MGAPQISGHEERGISVGTHAMAWKGMVHQYFTKPSFHAISEKGVGLETF